MDYELFTEVVDAFKEFQQSKNSDEKYTLIDFADWLKETKESKTDIATSEKIIYRNTVNNHLTRQFIHMNRYVRLLIRKGLIDFPELINEDHTYLFALMNSHSLTKMQLIEKSIHEKSTGLEIIRRLLKQNLIAEKADENDKRSKQVFMTEKGKAVFFSFINQMEKVSATVAGQLTIQEKEQLFGLLKKLEDFHNPIFLNEKKLTLDEIKEKYIT